VTVAGTRARTEPGQLGPRGHRGDRPSAVRWLRVHAHVDGGRGLSGKIRADRLKHSRGRIDAVQATCAALRECALDNGRALLVLDGERAGPIAERAVRTDRDLEGDTPRERSAGWRLNPRVRTGVDRPAASAAGGNRH